MYNIITLSIAHIF